MSHQTSPFPRCLHYQECAGCTEFLSLEPPAIWKEVITFFPSSLHPKLHAGFPLHWRHRAKVAVRGTVEKPLIGLFKKFSHNVLPIPRCLVHHPRLNEAFALVEKWMKQHSIIPYDELKKRGEVRYLQAVVERKSNLVQLALVLNASPSNKEVFERYRTMIVQLAEEKKELFHSIWINWNDRPTNTIFGPEWLHVWGKDLLWEHFGVVDVCYGPDSFGQANIPLFGQMLDRIGQLLPPQARVAEFYAGVGAIGLFVASRCEWVRCSEINPFAEKYFQQSRAQLPSEVSKKVSFCTEAAEKSIEILNGATTAIVDPPRKGLDRALIHALEVSPTLKQLLYISCGWEAFKRDCAMLKRCGWDVQEVDGYHFFPGTDHVELLVTFTR